MRARAPASAANLGPGFDALAVALALYVEVSVEAADQLVVSASGYGSHLPRGADHLAAKVASRVLGHDRLAITVRSEIPVGRGLGSSAALAVAAAAAAGAEDPFRFGVEADGHPENAAASTFGGLVAAASLRGGPVARRLSLDPQLAFVALIPDRELFTADARSVLPTEVPHADAAFNLGRLGLLVAGLADKNQLIPEAGEDRLHQDARAGLFPEAPALLAALRQAGAITSCWSGAGPTLLAVCEKGRAGEIAEAAGSSMTEVGVPGEVRVLRADTEGVTVSGRPAE